MGVIVRQKKKGKGNPWWVFVTHNGRRTSRLVGGKKAAEKAAGDIQYLLQRGEFEFEKKTKPSMPVFRDFAEGFMETYSPMHHKPSTQRSYQQVLEQHLNPVFGDLPLDQITRKHIKDFIAQKHQEGLKPNTIKNFKTYLSAILSEAVDDEIIPTHPALRTGKLIKKGDNAEDINPLTWEEKAKFEDTVREHFARWYPLFLTTLRTGLRLGELIALQPGDLDFNGGFIEVRRNFTRGHLTSTKSGKIRKVDMSKELQETLHAYMVQRKKDALRNGWGEPPIWLFYDRDGEMVNPDHLRKQVFYKILEKAGLRHIRVHDLRHTYATLRLNKGDNIVDVSNQLGHHSVKITLDVYAHWIPGGKKSEVDELDSRTAPAANGVSGENQ